MKVLRRSCAALIALLTCLGFTSRIADASSSESITVYNGQHPQTTSALISAFERQTGIAVAERDDDEDAMASQIVQEGTRSPADVVITENSPVLQFLQERGRLATIPKRVLSAVPAKYNSPKGEWVGISARVNVIVYNTRLIRRSQLPTSILAIASPRFRGKIGIASTETDFQPIVTSVAKSVGQNATVKWLEGVKANAGSNNFGDNETLVAKVNSGAVAFAVMNQYYWYRLSAELGRAKIDTAIAYFAPRDPGYVIDVSGAGVLSSSKHQAAAQRFVAFLVSKAGQQIIARSDSFEYPIGSGVVTAQPETKFSALTPASVSIADLGDGRLAVALMQRAGLN